MSRSNRPGGRGPSTQPCRDWREGVPNSCKFADRCNFAHSGGGRQNDPPAKGGGFGTFGSNNSFGSGGFGSTANSYSNTSFGGGNNASFGSSSSGRICRVRIRKKSRFQ